MSSRKTSDGESLITQVGRRAMATEFVVMLAPNCADSVEDAVAVLERLDAIEADLTVYQPSSEVSHVNRRAAEGPVPVSRATFALLNRAVAWSRRCDGAFDITSGPLVDAWGFSRRQGRKPSADELESALGRVGYEHLRLDQEHRTVAFARPGMMINLGAIGKGDALDRLARELTAGGVTDFLIHGGQSSVIARGDQVPGSDRGWAIGIAHPTKPQRRLTGVWLKDQAIGTSGSGKQFFHHRGRRYGHVIDPRTGQPAGDLLSLTVIMTSAADADACATGLFVAGSKTATRLRETAESSVGEPISMLAARAGRRQDDVELEPEGEFRWVDESAAGSLWTHAEDEH